ncbi:hypothetical protein Tsp_10398 [Trichinella spiralis]|uniref:hypothetical protein n=1 Tax=Trichinella spiralis TaxID=6334 RepID=UPI0001EFEAAC|nr:hypothetical protein Tsp_10398 [Trichinella spiralis]
MVDKIFTTILHIKFRRKRLDYCIHCRLARKEGGGCAFHSLYLIVFDEKNNNFCPRAKCIASFCVDAAKLKRLSAIAADAAEACDCCIASGLLKASDVKHILNEKVALLTGGRDRCGRPIISFPARENADKISAEDLRMVLLYLFAVPSDESKDIGFVVLIDMRNKMSWTSVKPIFKCLQTTTTNQYMQQEFVKQEQKMAIFPGGLMKPELIGRTCDFDISFLSYSVVGACFHEQQSRQLRVNL